MLTSIRVDLLLVNSLPGKGLLRYGSVRNYGTVRLDFGKKYDTELRTEFSGKVRYGNTILYFPYRTVHFPYSSNVRFALLIASKYSTFFALFLFAYNFATLIALAAHHQLPLTPHNYFKQQYCEQVKLLRGNYNSIVQP